MKVRSVITAEAGIQAISLDSRLRGNDVRGTRMTFIVRCDLRSRGFAGMTRKVSAGLVSVPLEDIHVINRSSVNGAWKRRLVDRGNRAKGRS